MPLFDGDKMIARRERHRFALYYEDDAGVTSAWTYWDLQQQANRLSNALRALGVKRGNRVAIILPQRPETAIAHIACYQMGAIAMPLSILFGSEALEYRLQDSETVAALVDDASLPNLTQIRDRLPLLRHVIGVAGARAHVTPHLARKPASDREAEAESVAGRRAALEAPEDALTFGLGHAGSLLRGVPRGSIGWLSPWGRTCPSGRGCGAGLRSRRTRR